MKTNSALAALALLLIVSVSFSSKNLGTNRTVIPATLEIIDVHTHAWYPEDTCTAFHPPSSWGHISTNEVDLMTRTLAQMDYNNIRQTVIFGENEVVLKWAQLHPTRFIPGWTIDFSSSNYFNVTHEAEAQELATLIRQGKMKCVGELGHSYAYPLDSPALFEIYRVAEELDVPVFFHTGESFIPLTDKLEKLNREDPKPGNFGLNMEVNSNPALLANIARKFPRLRIVACHAGFKRLDEMVAVMKEYPLICADISGLCHPGMEQWLSRSISRFRQEKMMHRLFFGSDQGTNDEIIPLAVRNALNILSPEEQRLVMHDNAARLLRLPDVKLYTSN